MQSYFLVHNLDGIVDGSETQPLEPAESAKWLLRQKKAAGFIAMKLDASNRDLFLTNDNRRNPRALWLAIELEYASKKARNRSRLFSRFLSLNCSDGNLSKYVSSFREVTREMANSGVHLDYDLLAHMALQHLPSDHSTTWQVIVATAESSNVALTLTGVLSQINTGPAALPGGKRGAQRIPASQIPNTGLRTGETLRCNSKRSWSTLVKAASNSSGTVNSAAALPKRWKRWHNSQKSLFNKKV